MTRILLSRHAKRILFLIVLTFLCSLSAMAGRLQTYRQFTNDVKASLVFRDDFNPTNHYPHVLKVFLRLDNVYNGTVFWVADDVSGIDVELFDANGKPVPLPPSAASITHNSSPFNIPYGSRLDWLITHSGVSMMGDATNKYALIIGGNGWLIPIETAGSYSLHIRLRGIPWTVDFSNVEFAEPELLLDLPPVKLEITK